MFAFDLAAVFFVVTSYISLALFVAQRFDPVLALCLGAFATVCLTRFAAGLPSGKRYLSGRDLLLIAVATFIFRANPFPWVIGGQDQGVYFQMSEEYGTHGSPWVHDTVRADLPSEELKRWYDATNQDEIISSPGRFRSPGRYEGSHTPGLFIANLANSTYVYQFYHLHPLWLAMGKVVFGPATRGYILVVFAIMSVLALSLVAADLSGRRSGGLLVGALLATSPAHAFFSKFPLSEIPTLAFNAIALIFLLRAWRASENGTGAIASSALVMAAGALGASFFCRISGFLFVPLIILYVWVLLANRRLTRQQAAFAAGALMLCAMSCIYGFIWSFPYAHETYDYSFGLFFGHRWGLVLVGLALMAVAMTALISRVERVRKAFSALVNHAGPPLAILILAIAFNVYRAFQLGFTDRFADNRVLKYFGGVKHGIASFPYSSIYALGLHLSPVGLLAFLVALISLFLSKIPEHRALGLLSLYFLTYCVAGEWTVPYEYYYSRYFVSETLPLAIVCLSVAGATWLTRRAPRWAMFFVTACMIGYGLLYLWWQRREREMEPDYSSISSLLAHVDARDMVLVAPEYAFHTPLRSAIERYFSKNVLQIDDWKTVPAELWFHLQKQYRDIFIFGLAGRDPEGAETIDRGTFEDGQYEHTVTRLPRRFMKGSTPVTLWRATSAFYDAMLHARLPMLSDGWSNGELVFLPSLAVEHPGRLIVDTRGLSPWLKSGEPKPTVEVNGRAVRLLEIVGKSFVFEIASDVRVIREVRIISPTFVPMERGMSSDVRRLGLDFDALWFEGPRGKTLIQRYWR